MINKTKTMSVHFGQNFGKTCRISNEDRNRFIYQSATDGGTKIESQNEDLEKKGKSKEEEKKEKSDAVKGDNKDQRTDHMMGTSKDLLDKVRNEKKVKAEEAAKLERTTGSLRSPLIWVGRKGSDALKLNDLNPFSEKSSVLIKKEVDKNFESNPDFPNILKKLGLEDQSQIDLMKLVIGNITADFINSLSTTDKDQIKKESEAEIQEKMLKKVLKMLNEFIAIFETKNEQGQNKYGFDTPTKVLRAFSNFTKTDFYKDKSLAKEGLTALLLQDEKTCETFTDNFKKWLELEASIKDLNNEEVKLQNILAKSAGTKPDIKSMLEAGTITVADTAINLPAAMEEKDVKAVFENSIRSALEQQGQKLDPDIQKQTIAYIMQEFDTLNPKPAPGLNYVLDKGHLKRANDPEVQVAKAKQEDAEAAAKKAAEDAVKNAPSSGSEAIAGVAGGSFLDNILAKIGPLIEKLLEKLGKLFESFGGNLDGPFDFINKVKEWAKFRPEEQKAIQVLYGAAKSMSSKIQIKHIEKWLKEGDQEQIRQVLNAKPGYLSWSTYLNQNAADLNGTNELSAKEIGERLLPKKVPPSDESNGNNTARSDEAVG